MKTETIATLRAKAKKLGLSGYSKLRKDELVKLIARQKSKTAAKSVTKSRTAISRPVATPTKSKRRPAKSTSSPLSSPSPSTPTKPVPPMAVEAEQRVETTKYAHALPGAPAPHYTADLGEDIDQLPVMREPLLCLLPQKPGVLHGYWTLPDALLGSKPSARLRLATLKGDHLTILEEHPVTIGRGHYYFQVGENIGLDTITLQLGSYQPDGKFVSLIQRGIARLPSLYASSQTDRRWWISDAQFRAMYQRAGGLEHDSQLGWAGTASSSGDNASQK
jgi:hypothetical protein